MLHLPPTALLDIIDEDDASNDGIICGCVQVLAETRRALKECVTREMRGPEALVALYQELATIVNIDADQHVEQVGGDDDLPSRELQEIQRLMDAASEVFAKSHSCVRRVGGAASGWSRLA